MSAKIITNVIGMVIGILMLLVAYLGHAQPITYVICVLIMISSMINIFLEMEKNCLFIGFKKNTQEIIICQEAKIITKTEEGKKIKMLKIDGFKESFNEEQFKSVKYNIGGFKKKIYFGLTDGVLITPFNDITITPLNVKIGGDEVLFVNNKLLAHNYQKLKAINKIAKPPNNIMVGLSLGVMIVVVLCTISILYNGGKLDFVAQRLEFLEGFANSITRGIDKGYYTIVQIGESVNNTSIDIAGI